MPKFTIVAALGTSADNGLRGIRGIRSISPAKSKHREGSILKIYEATGGHVEYTLHHEQHHGVVDRSLWSHRGWTLQELVFSQPALFFHEHTITWEWYCAIWHEKDISNTPAVDQSWAKNTKGFQYSAWPDLEEYARLVKNYSERNLMYVEDCPSGLLPGSRPPYHGRSRAVSFMDCRNCSSTLRYSGNPSSWSMPPSSLNSGPKRLACPACRGSDGMAAGSKSIWTCGRLASITCESAPDPPTGPALGRERPCAPNHSFDGTSSHNPVREPITHHILAYSQSRQNPRIPLPDGWSRERDAFRHVWDPTTSFEYPIPSKDAAEESDEPPHTSLLSFQAPRAWFALQIPGSSAYATEASIVAHSGEWAGLLRPYVSDSVRVLWNASRGAPWVLPELLASPHTNMLRGICGAWHLWTSPKAP